jgi:nucleotide-binding universal stress UspA family protein
MKSVSEFIIVPIDFEPASLKALKSAMLFAKRQKTTILLLNVIQTPGFFTEIFTSGDEIVKLTNHIKDKLNNLAFETKNQYPDVEIITRVESGKAYKKIIDVAKEIKPRLIIMGENNEGNNAEQKLGTTVYQVTLQSPTPVLTIKGEFNHIGDKIVVPLDLTKNTSKQVFAAIVYGLRYGAKVYLTSALIGGVSIEQSRINKKIENALITLKENNVECDYKLFERSDVQPYQRVLEYSKEIEADLILIMTHQEGFTYDNYIGAFAHHIINESQVPVLSLTSSASDESFSSLLTTFVDPANVLSNKK